MQEYVTSLDGAACSAKMCWAEEPVSLLYDCMVENPCASNLYLFLYGMCMATLFQSLVPIPSLLFWYINQLPTLNPNFKHFKILAAYIYLPCTFMRPILTFIHFLSCHLYFGGLVTNMHCKTIDLSGSFIYTPSWLLPIMIPCHCASFSGSIASFLITFFCTEASMVFTSLQLYRGLTYSCSISRISGFKTWASTEQGLDSL